MSEISTSKTVILLDPSLKTVAEIENFLLVFFLQSQNYELHLDHANLLPVESAFDSLIRRYGLRGSNFDFRFSGVYTYDEICLQRQLVNPPWG